MPTSSSPAPRLAAEPIDDRALLATRVAHASELGSLPERRRSRRRRPRRPRAARSPAERGCSADPDPPPASPSVGAGADRSRTGDDRRRPRPRCPPPAVSRSPPNRDCRSSSTASSWGRRRAREDGLFLTGVEQGPPHASGWRRTGFQPQSFEVDVVNRPIEVEVGKFLPVAVAAPQSSPAAAAGDPGGRIAGRDLGAAEHHRRDRRPGRRKDDPAAFHRRDPGGRAHHQLQQGRLSDR